MFEHRVKEFLSRHLPPLPRILVGLSGGADSVALLLSLRAAGAECVAAHCNFHLRGEESERDRRHCEELCKTLGIPLLIKDFDVERYRTQTSESVEMACRSLRYAWWNELITSGYADYVAVGHHREDNVETFFLNLMRGGGIAGLKAMLPVNNHIIRPLLEVSRQEIEGYVSSRGFTWVTDRTNLENEFTRNRLRNIILPMFESEFPGAVNSIIKTLGVLRDNYDLYTNAIRQYADTYIDREKDGKIAIDISRLIAEQPASHAILHELLSPLGLTHSQINDIYTCTSGLRCNASSGQSFTTTDASFILERGLLTSMPETEDKTVEGTIDLLNTPEFTVAHLTPDEFNSIRQARAFDNKSIYLDSSALCGNPTWSIRTRRQGDRLAPYGMRGTRLVSDIYSDAKLTAEQKRTTPLLLRDGVIIWVIGLRASRHFVVTSSSTEIIRITIQD